MNSGSPPTNAWAHTLEGLDNLGGFESAVWVSPETKARPRPKPSRRAAFCVTRRYRAAPERVFAAWLDPETAGKWLFATASRPMVGVEIDARVGGSFRFVELRDGKVTERSGEYLEIVPHWRLAFSLSMEKRPEAITRVVVEIAPTKRGCALTLTHEHVRPADARRTEGRWIGILYGLGVNLDSVHGFHDDQE